MMPVYINEYDLRVTATNNVLKRRRDSKRDEVNREIAEEFQRLKAARELMGAVIVPGARLTP